MSDRPAEQPNDAQRGLGCTDVVMPSPGMRWIYQRTQVPVTIVKVKAKQGWPHHTLRAIFQDGDSAFTFHCEMIAFYFRQVPVEA